MSQITETTGPAGVAIIELHALVGDLQVRYPQAALMFGYIGNLYPDRDDRGWAVFTAVDRPAPESRREGLYRWGDYGTDDLPKMAANAASHLESWVRCVVGLEEWPDRAVTRKSRGLGG